MRRLLPLLLLLPSCGKPPPPPGPATPAPPPRLAPALTRPVVTAFVASLLDPDLPNPEPGPSAGTTADAASLRRSEAFAQKYGFRDFAEYAEARRRVMLAKLAWMKREIAKSSGGNLDFQIKIATSTLLNPDATQEQKDAATNSLNRAMQLKKSLESPSAASTVAEEDIALVAEFAEQINRAEEAAAKR
ncbi:MAG: hypothetical protein FD180_2686 [Planctomycetota bacterium]|nr:MAG: hypothetical protein FD180_2686 [Planctomycetota bacterium]